MRPPWSVLASWRRAPCSAASCRNRRKESWRTEGMRIAYITAGAAGMFCGSCMHDNTLVAALQRQGHDAVLVPTYTPIRTDEEDVSEPRIFFGGLNVYLQQKLGLFRHTPRFLD